MVLFQSGAPLAEKNLFSFGVKVGLDFQFIFLMYFLFHVSYRLMQHIGIKGPRYQEKRKL